MAAFDSRLAQIVVRIVYDGAGTAGKTTNLLSLQELFTRGRRGEMVTPETTQGRTLYFDHMPLEGGLIAGHRFRCELWTVPGQDVLRHRRDFLLARADVVVFVLDSREGKISDATRLLTTLRAADGGFKRPLVVQANKQDEDDALPPAEIRRVLELDEKIPVVAAVAHEGKGVRDTALWAMRLAAMELQPRVIQYGPEVLGADVELPEDIHRQMRRLPLAVPAISNYSSEPPPGEDEGEGEEWQEELLPLADELVASVGAETTTAAVDPRDADEESPDLADGPQTAEAAQTPAGGAHGDDAHDRLTEGAKVVPRRTTPGAGADDLHEDTLPGHPLLSAALLAATEQVAAPREAHLNKTDLEPASQSESHLESQHRQGVGADSAAAEERHAQIEHGAVQSSSSTPPSIEQPSGSSGREVSTEGEVVAPDPQIAVVETREAQRSRQIAAAQAAVEARDGRSRAAMVPAAPSGELVAEDGAALPAPPTAGTEAGAEAGTEAGRRRTPLPAPPPPCGDTAADKNASAEEAQLTEEVQAQAPTEDTNTATHESRRPTTASPSQPAGPGQRFSRIPPGLPVPTLPSSQVRSFNIWPPASGRESLKLVPFERAEFRPELRLRKGKEDGSGKADTYVYRAGTWCLKTSGGRCYSDEEHARAALVQLARRKVALGEQLPPHTVLVVQEGEHGFWLWTVSPWLRSLRFEMTEAEAIHSHASLSMSLCYYAQASVAALNVLRERHVVMDVHPSNFARVGQQLVYLDDDIMIADRIPTIGHAWLRRVDEYRSALDAVERYIAELEGQIQSRLTHEDVLALDLEAAVAETLVQSELAQEARERLLFALRACQ